MPEEKCYSRRVGDRSDREGVILEGMQVKGGKGGCPSVILPFCDDLWLSSCYPLSKPTLSPALVVAFSLII